MGKRKSRTQLHMATSENSSSEDHLSASQEVKSKDNSEDRFSKDEEDLIIRMYKLLGERWSLIAGRIPGRTADEIKNYWIYRDPARDVKKHEMNCQEQ